jgi:WD40 repeat protein
LHPLPHPRIPPTTSHTPHPSPTRPPTLQFEAVIFDHVYDDELASITGHFGPINTLAFAPHGRSYASGGEDGYVRITHFPEDYFDAFSKKSAEAFGRPWPEKK